MCSSARQNVQAAVSAMAGPWQQGFAGLFVYAKRSATGEGGDSTSGYAILVVPVRNSALLLVMLFKALLGVHRSTVSTDE